MQNQVEQVISQLTGNATMFTAYDITMMLRRANPTTNIRHSEIRDIVTNMHNTTGIPGYARTHQTLAGGQDAFVYHPYFGSDPEDYDPNFLSTTTPQLQSNQLGLTGQIPIQVAGNLQTTTQTTTSPLGNRPKRAKYALDSVPKDKFGRLRIPASVLRSAGFNPGDSARIVLDPNVIVITPNNDVYGSTNGKRYVVDMYNNIRVHLRGKYNADKFRIESKNNRLYVNPV